MMRRRILFLLVVSVFYGAGSFLVTSNVIAEPIAVTDAFSFRDNRSENNVFGGPGDRLTFGAQSVVPDGYGGTTGSATQGSVTRTLTFLPFSTSPHQFANSVPYDSSLTGQWNLTFTNGGDTTNVQTPSVDAAPQLPFASNVAISGSGLTPTFSWTVPGGFTLDGVRLQIWDLENRLPDGTGDDVHSVNFQGNPGSYTVPATFSSGKSLQEGHLYSFEISFAQTRGVPLGNNATLLSRSRSFFDFVPLPASAPPNVFLPVVIPGPTPVYSFHTTVVEGQTIFIDPPVAIGYDYAIGTGNPNFASVTLATGIGDNSFDLYLFDGTNWVFKTYLTGGNTYTFDPGGVDRFRILGIELSAGLDPQNPTAFITGLTFVASGEFTGTMTPLTNFSMELYDDFSGTYIDKTKWRQGEWVREIREGKLIVKQSSAPYPIGINTPYGESNWLSFPDPNSVNSIQADVTILESSITNSAQTRARLAGVWYLAAEPGPGLTGDMWANVEIRETSAGLFAQWSLGTCGNADCTVAPGYSRGGNFSTPISLGKTYKLYIEYDSANHQFIFKVDDEQIVFNEESLPIKLGDAVNPTKGIGTRVVIDNATSLGYISAAFDNVYKNGVLYDDFSSSIIDPTKWTSYEFVREISEGKLRSEVRSSSASTSSISNRLEFVDPSSINILQAKVTPLTYQNTQGANIVARMGGHYYNDGTPGGGHFGEVGAEVYIGGFEGEANPAAGWAVWTYADFEGNNPTLIETGNFSKPISLGDTYTLLIGWTGSYFIFNIDDEEDHYTPTTTINPPNSPWKEIGTRIMNPAGKETTIEALFDDVMVGAACCPAIDVNPQSIDFGKVLPGNTSDQTVIITNVGSVTLTLGTIGSPSPPFSITGGTCTNNQTLPPQGSCTLIIGFAPTAYGVYTSSFTIPSDDPVNSVVTVTINGTSPDHFTLTVSKSGTGNGSVTSSPAGINCGSDCTEDFKVGTKITLKAKADTNSTFTGWSGGGCSGTGTCAVIMNADIAVTAGFAAKAPDISVPSSSVDFGTLAVGKKITKTLKIANNGSGDLLITLSGLEGTDFSIQGSSSVTIKAKKTYSLKVLCTPTSAGLKTATLKIDSNDADTPTLEISLTGTLPATTPDISVTQNSLDFGSVKIGKKVTKTLKIGNNGSGDLLITLSGLEETDFSIQGSSSVTIKAKKSYSLKVLFTPTSAELKIATLEITSNDPDTPTIDISLSGAGQ
jgi:hypothetical protein